MDGEKTASKEVKSGARHEAKQAISKISAIYERIFYRIFSDTEEIESGRRSRTET